MPNPMALVQAGKDHNEVLHAIAEATTFELNSAVRKLSVQEAVQLGNWVSDTCRTVGVQKVLIFGGLLHFFAAATDAEDRREIYDNLLADLALSPTQAQRCRDTWVCFGNRLIIEPAIREKFVAESLKILSEKQTTEAAREAALELARSGERVSIKVARQYQKEYREQEPRTPQAPQRTRQGAVRKFLGKVTAKGWQFFGRVVHITLEPASDDESVNAAAVIRDLEEAIEKLRIESEFTTQKPALPAGGSDSHV